MRPLDKQGWAAALAMFLTVFGAHLWLARVNGVALPFWDQWDAEAAVLLKPWREGTLAWPAFFAPHNEHRIPLTRALNFALTALGGCWDAQVEIVCNACLWAAGLAAGTLVLRARPLAVCAAGAFFSLPYGWENTLGGFQSQFYFLVLFSLAAVWGLVGGRRWEGRWIFGLAAGGLALGSMGSGFFWAPAAAAGVGWRLGIERRRPDRCETATLLVCGLVLALAWQGRVAPPPDAPATHAESVRSFFETLGKCAAWPWTGQPWLAVLLWAPLAWLASRRQAGSATLLAAGAWVCAHVLAFAWARGLNGEGPASRYADVLAFAPLCNGLALWRLRSRTAAAAWGVICLAGLAQLTSTNLRRELPPRRHLYHQQEINVRGYLASGDAEAWLFHREFLAVPFPDPARLQTQLDDPAIRSLLPPAYLPLGERSAATTLSRQCRGLLRSGWLICLGGVALGLAVTGWSVRPARRG